MTTKEWQIKDTQSILTNKNKWLEEEEFLVEFSDNPVFEKTPLERISLTFIYVDLEKNIVGGLNTNVNLKKSDFMSSLKKTDFFEKIDLAKRPENIVHFKKDELLNESSSNSKWLKKSYIFEDASLYSVPIDHENIYTKKPANIVSKLKFTDDVEKIVGSLTIFHDLYDIFIIMREDTKSILKTGEKNGRTKKVRISNNYPKTHFYSQTTPMQNSKRFTKKNRNSIIFANAK